jgi:integration host factor subunit alpha
VARRIQSWIERINVALTKADLVDSIHEKIGFSKKEAADMVELIFDTMKAELNGSGGKIKISGFGNFVDA